MKKHFLFLLPSLFLLTACSSDEPEVNPDDKGQEQVGDDSLDFSSPQDLELSKSQKASLNKTNDFSMLFFNTIAKNYELYSAGAYADNLSVSPFSVSTSLAMTANTVWQPTRDEIATALGYQNVDDMNETLGYICDWFNRSANTGMDYKVSNSLWWRSQYSDYLDHGIVKTLEDYYKIYSEGVDFNNDATIDAINGWVADNTNNKIQNFLSYLNQEQKKSTSHINVNTVYVNSEWENEFKPENTDKATFHGTSGAATVDMMHGVSNSMFMEDESYKCVRLDFAGTASMYIVMPKAQSVVELSKSFGNEELSGLISKMKAHEVEMALPKFDVKFKMEATSDVFAEAGISFESAKNILFGEVSTALPFNSQLVHETTLTINEEGAEMAAASAYVIYTSDLEKPQLEKATMKVDSPFLYFIIERTTGAVLMAGRICNL